MKMKPTVPFFRLPESRRAKNKTGRRGTLIAIGGALQLAGPILPEFFRRSGGKNGRIVILPTASNLTDSGCDVAERLAQLGLRAPAVVLPLHERSAAYEARFCEQMKAATGLYITGGDQARLLAILWGTPFYRALQSMYQHGGTVAGTSAGTASLSQVMIAEGRSGTLPQPHMAKLDAGLGLIDSCIFDQHFRQRNRIGRLSYAVSLHPNLLGIGVDEDTAAVIEGSSLTVLGSGAVTLVDASAQHRRRLKNEPASMAGMRIHLLTAGRQFDLRKPSLFSS